MQLGLVTYQWGADWDLPTVIKNCEQTGFAGVELRSTHKHGVEPSLNESERKEVAQRFADSGVELVGLGTACEYHSPDPAELKKNIEETKAFIRCATTWVARASRCGPTDCRPACRRTRRSSRSATRSTKWPQFGEGYGVEIRLEIHGRGTSEIPVIRKIMDVSQHPNSKLCWNCNATDLDGAGLEANFNSVQDRIATVHIHDLICSYPWAELFGAAQRRELRRLDAARRRQQDQRPGSGDEVLPAAVGKDDGLKQPSS